MNISVLQSPLFIKPKKKLHQNQIKVLDKEIKNLIKNPGIGKQKKGDLRGVWVHKFNVKSQLFLLAYTWDSQNRYLIAINTHEGFYKSLKRYLK